MDSKNFSWGFVSAFVAVIVILVVIFFAVSSSWEVGASRILWAVIIFLFLVVGIIIISLYVNRSEKH